MLHTTEMNSLLSPFQLNSLKLPNRVVMAPMTRNKSKRNVPGPDVAQYYRRRAEGGVSLIITEGTAVGHKASHAYPNVPNFHGKEALEGWRKVVEEVHRADGKIFPQLWHVGSVRQTHHCHNEGVDNSGGQCCYKEKVPGYAPSPIPHPYIKGAEIPHEMSKKDILDVIEAFAKAALNAKKLGFDGVEIHGAHGYLIDQFFWAYTNQRTDEYGGTLGQRTRFATEVVQAVRNAVGQDFPIDFRFSQWKLGDYNAKLANSAQELEFFLLPLVTAGVDLFHCSTRHFWDLAFSDSPLTLAGWTKKITGKPTIAVGSVGLDLDFIATKTGHSSPLQTLDKMNILLNSLEKGEFDLIAIGRALLGDPLWIQKIAEGRINEITLFSKKALDDLF